MPLGGNRLLGRVADLPTACVAGFEFASGVIGLELQNPGGKIRPDERRLVLAGLAPNRCFLHYELGGKSSSYHVAVIETDSVGRRRIWHATLASPQSDLGALRRAVLTAREDNSF